jgi:hypothetical protein
MYTIQNFKDGTIHKFAKVREACKYLKELKEDSTKVTKDEIIDLCNIFARYKNKIAINYGVPK